ncbi:hypothetical protein [Hypericibacter sp.]|uniref:hypothetical protein n=1 Tax=Hypericibacter sp. TaxID=2705401 RepID=UPI003D6D9176
MSLSDVIRRAIDRFMGGRGEFSITVPVMDGPLKPNDYLERAESIAMVMAADNAAALGDVLLVSSGHRLLEVNAKGGQRLHSEHEAPVSCLAVSKDRSMAIGLDGQGVKIVGGRHDGKRFDRLGSGALKCPTAAAFLDEDTLVVANGSAEYPAAKWAHDLLHRGQSGTITRIDLGDGKATDLATRLRFPAGLCIEAGEILASEAWRHRLIALANDGPSCPRTLLSDLPAYPGRICAAKLGGYWLSCVAARSQLQEFVLREDRYRRQMIAEIDPEFWIAPALSSGRSFKEPLQAGGVIRLGIHKPWAPTRSQGLIFRLDEGFQPVWSAHSRADGKRHGITSLVEHRGMLIATSKGKGEVIAIGHTALPEPADLATSTEHAA